MVTGSMTCFFSHREDSSKPKRIASQDGVICATPSSPEGMHMGGRDSSDEMAMTFELGDRVAEKAMIDAGAIEHE